MAQSNTTNNNNITAAYIDLATYDEIDKSLYGGKNAITYFTRYIKRSSWFSTIPITLRVDGSPSQPYYKITRTGDFLLRNWLRFTLPEVPATRVAPTLPDQSNRNQYYWFLKSSKNWGDKPSLYTGSSGSPASPSICNPCNFTNPGPFRVPDAGAEPSTDPSINTLFEPNLALADQPAFAVTIATDVAWTKNVGHNIFETNSNTGSITLLFNELPVQTFDNVWLDFWSQLSLDASKATVYSYMIGNRPELIDWNASLPRTSDINVNLPFFYYRDTGVSLPTAALPYNDMRIVFNFVRNPFALLRLRRRVCWQDLSYDTTTVMGLGPVGYVSDAGDVQCSVIASSYRPFGLTSSGTVDSDLLTGFMDDADPNGTNETLTIYGIQLSETLFFQLQLPTVWAEYAIVSNQERAAMTRGPRDILIEQVQLYDQVVESANNGIDAFNDIVFNIDIRFNYPMKALFWGAWNEYASRILGLYSTYTTDGYCVNEEADKLTRTYLIDGDLIPGRNPITFTSLLYENTARLDRMPTDYFTQVEPFYKWASAAVYRGYQTYSYAQKPLSVDPTGSTNYSKLTVSMEFTFNVPRNPQPGDDGFGEEGSPSPFNRNRFSIKIRGLNMNIVRISGGALGFPSW